MKKSVFLASLFFLSTILVTGQEKKLTIDLSLGSMKYLVNYGYFEDFRLEGSGTGLDIRLNQSWYGLSIGYWNYHDLERMVSLFFPEDGYVFFDDYRKKTLGVQLHAFVLDYKYIKLSLNGGMGRSFSRSIIPTINIRHPEFEKWFTYHTFDFERSATLIYGFEIGLFPTKYGMPLIRCQYFYFLNSSKSGMAMVELGARFRIMQ